MKKAMRNKKLSSIVAIFAAAIAVFSAANFARAADSSYIGLTISEIVYNPAGKNSDHAKWIEISNLSAKKMTLYTIGNETTSGWKIKDIKLADPSNHYLYTQTNAPIEIDPGDLLIIADNLTNFDKDYPDLENVAIAKSAITLTTADSSGSYALNIYDNSNLLDTVAYSKDWYPNTDDKGKSLEKIDLLGDNTKENWQESCEDGGTPGEEPKICETETVSADEDSNAANPDDDSTNSPEKCTAFSADIKINELFPYPSSGDEFIEITNTGESCVDVSDWKVMDEASHKKTFPENSIIEPGKYLYLEGNLYLNNALDTAYLMDANGNAKNDALDKVFYEKAKENHSYALSDGSFSWASVPTPGEKNVFNAPIIEASTEASIEASTDSDGGAATDGNVYLNEIMPNPKDGSDGEYIEIANGSTEPVDLFGWRIKDASKSKGYQFKEHTIISPGEYLAIYRPASKIALNNSDESVYLYNPKNEIASSVSFAKSIKNSSYNFDGKIWKWSKYLTPNKKNKLDSEPSVKITKPKHTYKDLFTEFSANAKDKETKKLKYSWDFGDGKKSNLAKTSHKYLATGKYTVVLSVSDDSQTVEKSFTLEVKKYPRLDLEIVKIVPNPAGSDAETETIDLKNNSAKKINLAGWKIATSSGEKIYNHPISGEFSLDANETKTITREFSKFSLNNKAGKVQLTMPDGKVTDVVEYAKDPPDSLRDSKRAGKIADDEAYAKIDGEWKWLEPGAQEENTNEAVADEESDSEEVSEEDTSNDGEVLGAIDENELTLSNYNPVFSSEDAFIFLSNIGFLKSQNKEVNYCPLKNTTASLEYFLISSI